MLLKLEHVSKSYPGGRPGVVRKVLEDLNWSLVGGESVAITGRSGSGKSTLLNLIGTLDRPDHGSMSFRGRDLLTLESAQLELFRNQSIGFIFQMHHLLPQLTVLENVLIPTLAPKPHVSSKEQYQRAQNLLQDVGLWDLRDQYPGKLSGGECQRVAVVRALINQPDLLLADEPTGALDEDNAHKLIDLLISLQKKENTTLVMVTHARELAARMERSFELKQGKLFETNSRS